MAVNPPRIHQAILLGLEAQNQGSCALLWWQADLYLSVFSDSDFLISTVSPGPVPGSKQYMHIYFYQRTGKLPFSL